MKIPCTLTYGSNSNGDYGYYLTENTLLEIGDKAINMLDKQEWIVGNSYKNDPRYYTSLRVIADANIIFDAYTECKECEGNETEPRFRSITTEDVETIKENNYRCFIEMYETLSENNSEESKLTPLLYKQSIIIHLTK